MKFNEKEVRACYKFLNHLNETEIRIIDPRKKMPPKSFFVHSEDEFVNICKEYNEKYNLYVGINERDSKGTSKQDVLSIKTIVIDIDAIRKNPSEQPANEEELKNAEKIANNIIAKIKISKQPLPIKLNSGNGYQLWFAIPEIKIDNYNRQEIEDKVQLFQDKIKEKFDVDDAIDKVGDLPRIIKIWGTYNIKGKESENRVYRIAKVIGTIEREENEFLKEQILELEKQKIPEYEIDEIDEIIIDNLPPCINHLIKFYENKDGKYWYRIIQLLSSFFYGIGLKRENALNLIMSWNKKQSYHESGEEKEIEITVNRIYKNKINIPNCKKIKSETGGFPYFGLGDLKLCKPDARCNKCINPIIRYKRASEKPSEIGETFAKIFDKKEIANRFKDECPFFYDKAKIWWFWDKNNKYWEQVDETDLLNGISKFCALNTINSKEKTEMIEAMKQVGRRNRPKEIKKSWIQFKDELYDVLTGERLKATSEYFVTNPIPYKINEENFIETPTMDRIFEEWVGKEHVKTLYEIIAYCLLPDYPIHRLFCLIGEGLNGKSCFMRLLSKFIGERNMTSTELDILLDSRFEITRLYKKLVCVMGETNFAEMTKTSIIKKLTGQDTIGFEYKNKTPFDDYNYAKIIIATNNLPTTTDKTIGFYRRWLIIDFPNRFSEEKDILNDIPEEEYENLTLKSVFILKDLLKERHFTNEGTIEERQKKYEDKSDPLEKFMKENTNDDPDGWIFKWEFEKRLNDWCKENRFRHMAENTIGKKMKEKGILEDRKNTTWWEDGIEKQRRVRCWMGIKWKFGQDGQDGQSILT